MNSSSNVKNTGKGAIGWFRSGIRFSERLFKNSSIQMKWMLNIINKINKAIHDWRVRNYYHPSIEYTVGVIVTLIFMFIVFPLLILWAVVKSI